MQLDQLKQGSVRHVCLILTKELLKEFKYITGYL